ncbi:hypothetical protein [Reichenbachiella sp.]|uniref:hypothetical protein n=1 Tax=Reichenbachiella sp. TaxID=2184521 RepID=UPI003BB03AD9
MIDLYLFSITTQTLSSIIIGVGTGLASSFMFLWFLTTIRPKVRISTDIAEDTIFYEGETHKCFRCKVINDTWKSRIYDIEAQLVLIKYVTVDGGQNLFMDKIPLIKERTWSLNRYSKKDTHAEYAFQFITIRDLYDIWDDNVNIELRIKAKHAFSGFTRTDNYRYFKTNCIKKGSFKFGNTMEIT